MKALKRSKMKVSASRWVFVVCNTALMVLLSFLFIFPYLNILATALNDASDTALGGIVFWPRSWTLDNLQIVLIDKTTWTGFTISVLRVVVGSLVALLVTYMAGYAMLRKGLPGRAVIVGFLTVPMFFGGGIIANIVVYRMIGVYNTFWVYILPCAFSFYNMVVVRTYLMTIPESLPESARLDGANELQILFRIMFPLSMPIVAVILLWNAVFYWNDWSTTLYYVNRSDLYTMQFNLQMMLKKQQNIQDAIANAVATGKFGNLDSAMTPEAIQAAQILVTTLPIVVVYPFVQKYFVQGVMIGSVKE